MAIGVALLAGAAILAPLAYRAVRRSCRRHGPYRPRSAAVAKRAGQPITVAGVAVAGPGGVLESQLARTDCVWHGHEVLRHFWVLPGDGDEGQERACDSIADYASTEPFGLAVPGRTREGSTVLVDPAGAELSGADMCLQRLVGRPQRGVPAPADDLLARVKGRISGIFRGETIEFEYREWVLRHGSRIVAHGMVELRDGRPVIVPPPHGRLRVERDDSAARTPWFEPRTVGAVLLGAGTAVSAGAGLLLTLGLG
ncbi:hypothetical protein EFW17_14280 [Halostreptopolyspora alba]|uniref:RING-type E3 ubiquitin transferase n=1 Tax=Halostreptopolyspora alba TaxID=2487137 RepID=A0A3N0E888_9ACTN|nr:hypothetical protein EFW17_14280 [Nocardiopsaceae bacterium YIM 96095]